MSNKLQTLKIFVEEIARYFNISVFIQERIMEEDKNEHPTVLAYYVPVEQRHELIVIHDGDGDIINPDKSSEEVMYVRLYSFLDSIDINITYDTKLLMILLHEFGHFDFLELMYEYNFGGQYMYISDIVKEYPTKAWTLGEYAKARSDGYDIAYMIRGDEMYSDAFTMRNFMPMYKILKTKKLI